jgi:hypothetical protein
MTTIKRIFKKFERPFWTFLQAGLATVTVTALPVGLPIWAIPLIAYGLAEAKRYVLERREAAAAREAGL